MNTEIDVIMKNPSPMLMTHVKKKYAKMTYGIMTEEIVIPVLPKHALFNVSYFILAKLKNYTLFLLFSVKYLENTLF